MDPVKREDPRIGSFKGEIRRKKVFVKKQSASVAKTDEKVASAGKFIKFEWKSFTAWLSKIFTSPSRRLQKQIATLKQKTAEQNPATHSVAYVSHKACQISCKPQFATIAKDLQRIASVSSPIETAKIIQEAREKLLTLIPDERDQWNAELRQELWRLLILTSCDQPPVSIDRFLNHIAKLLSAVKNSPEVERELKDYSSIVEDALSGLTSRLTLIEIENKLDLGKENFPLPNQEALQAFQELRYFPQQTDFALKVTAKNFEKCLAALPKESSEPYKQLVVHANNPIWCSKEGMQKLSQVSLYLQNQSEDNTLLISKIQLLKKAIQELMR